MTAIRDRALSILELLAAHVEGLSLSDISDRLNIPRSATHRVLNDLREMGYVKQNESTSHYALTVKLAALGLSYLSATGINDISQPILDELAEKSAELVRLAIFEENQLIWIAKAQGAKTGLRYDPDAGIEVYFPATATGMAWLAAHSKEQALELTIHQGFEKAKRMGPNAPVTIDALLGEIEKTKEQGYAWMVDTYVEGTSSVAMVIADKNGGKPMGVLTVSGPSVRFNEEAMRNVLPDLKQAVFTLSQVRKN
ncbi:IclR family transcriptional regulator [Paenalcaligenes hominis]|uniref:IclR family transcriptional regulator n=1 Tax=Paenalcaligenes hominis TaxID=643674 RepID=UPI003524D427